MKRIGMKQNQLNPLNPLTIPGFFKGVVRQNLNAQQFKGIA
mgnify:CR=1 FL=1